MSSNDDKIQIKRFPSKQLGKHRLCVALYEAKYHKNNIFISCECVIEDYDNTDDDVLSRTWYTLYLDYNKDGYDRYDIHNMNNIIHNNIDAPYDRNSVLLTETNELLKELLSKTKKLKFLS